MMSIERHTELLKLADCDDLSTTETLSLIGELIDGSYDLANVDGLTKAIEVGSELRKHSMKGEEAGRLHYFLGNAWSHMNSLGSHTTEWEAAALERSIYHFRAALSSEDGVHALPAQVLCQINTNLANSLSEVGRVVEAIESWEDALRIVPGYGMTVGSQGYGLCKYAYVVPDPGHARFIMTFARDHLKNALSSPLESEAARAFFTNRLTQAEDAVGGMPTPDEVTLNSSSLGRGKREIRYRQWCLRHRLFLNPLNDLGEYSIGARDRVTLPSMVRPMDEGPIFQGLFNQLKQEFTSARFLYYDGLQPARGHFADRGVYQLNTLDYPSYSLNTEKTKSAFRVAYSVFDKIAFFLNSYFEFGMAAAEVSFRRIWYVKGDRKKGLRPDLQTLHNWPLRALFWVGKDLSETRPEFTEAMQPDARLLAEIRNHVEHKYLKLHDDEWPGPTQDPTFRFMDDTLALSIYRRDFERKTLRILKLVRASIIYLVTAVRVEEQRRAQSRGSVPVAPIALDVWEDRWKE